MLTVVGSSFHRFIATKSEIQNIRLSLQPPGRKPPHRVQLKSTNRATQIGFNPL